MSFPVPSPVWSTLRVERDGDVATLVLARPERLNALSAAMQSEVRDALGYVAACGARGLVIRGEGRGFCAGADLRALAGELDLDDPAAVERYVLGWGANIEALLALEIPSIAAVHGVAYGGGFSLAIACDLVIAAPDARFNTQYLNIGINPDLGSSWLLPRRIGAAAARALFLYADEFNGERAYALGLVAELADEAQLVDRAQAQAARLAARPPDAVAATRALLTNAAATDLATALRAEAQGIARRFATPEFRTVLGEFTHRSRPPGG